MLVAQPNIFLKKLQLVQLNREDHPKSNHNSFCNLTKKAMGRIYDWKNRPKQFTPQVVKTFSWQRPTTRVWFVKASGARVGQLLSATHLPPLCIIKLPTIQGSIQLLEWQCLEITVRDLFEIKIVKFYEESIYRIYLVIRNRSLKNMVISIRIYVCIYLNFLFNIIVYKSWENSFWLSWLLIINCTHNLISKIIFFVF